MLLKIDDCIKQLETAHAALAAAPEKGFVDLDQVQRTLQAGRDLLIELAPRLSLGEKLADGLRADLLAKLQVLKTTGGGVLADQAEQYLHSEYLEYEKLIALQNEIDLALRRVFGGFSKHTGNQPKPAINSSPKADDYR
jgi:hypothetical protein